MTDIVDPKGSTRAPRLVDCMLEVDSYVRTPVTGPTLEPALDGIGTDLSNLVGEEYGP